MLGARIVVAQRGLVKNESHLLTPITLMYSSNRLVRKSWIPGGLRTSTEDQVGVAEIVRDHFGVANRKGLGTAAVGPGLPGVLLFVPQCIVTPLHLP